VLYNHVGSLLFGISAYFGIVTDHPDAAAVSQLAGNVFTTLTNGLVFSQSFDIIRMFVQSYLVFNNRDMYM